MKLMWQFFFFQFFSSFLAVRGDSHLATMRHARGVDAWQAAHARCMGRGGVEGVGWTRMSEVHDERETVDFIIKPLRLIFSEQRSSK